MEITGHSLSLQPKHPFALALKLTPELQRALLDAHKNGTAVKFRAEDGAKGALTAILTIANSRHRFNGYSTDNQKALFLTDDEDIEDGYVVANVTHKLHQQKSLPTSNISSKLRASAQEASRHKESRQMQLLDAPVQLKAGLNGRRGIRSVTPPASAGPRHMLAQPIRQLTPPPGMPSAGGGGRQQQQIRPQHPACRPGLGRSLTPPPNARASPPPPAPVRAQVHKHQQQAQHKSREPPKPKSLGGGGGRQQQQQQRRTPPLQGAHPSTQQQQQTGSKAGRPSTASAGGSVNAAGACPGVAGKPPARGVSPGSGAAAATSGGRTAQQHQQQAVRTGLPLIQTAPLQAASKQQQGPGKTTSSGKAPAAQQQLQQVHHKQVGQLGTHLDQQQQGVQQQASKPSQQVPQSTGSSRATSQQGASAGAAAKTTATGANQLGAGGQQRTGAKRPLAPPVSTNAPTGAAADGAAAKKQRVTGQHQGLQRSSTGGQTVSAGAASSRSRLIPTAEHRHRSRTPPGPVHTMETAASASAAAHQQQQQPGSVGMPAVAFPDAPVAAMSGGSPVQQEQHTKHWFTSSSEDSGLDSVGGGAASVSMGCTHIAGAGKHGPEAGWLEAECAKPKVAPEAARASWAVAIKAKTQQRSAAGGVLANQAAAPVPGHSHGHTQQQQQQQLGSRQQSHHMPSSIADIGPPAYRAFVNVPPRTFAPISNEEQYRAYYRQYQDQYATYYTLSMLIQAAVTKVSSAFEQLSSMEDDSPALLAAAAEVRAVIDTKSCLTKPWNSAFQTLHQELSSLRQHLKAWTQQQALEKAGYAAAGDVQPELSSAEQRQGFRGKGAMAAAGATTAVGA